MESQNQEKRDVPINLTEMTPFTGNHLDVPKANENNPNLLSPEVMSQRRGRLINNNWLN